MGLATCRAVTCASCRHDPGSRALARHELVVIPEGYRSNCARNDFLQNVSWANSARNAFRAQFECGACIGTPRHASQRPCDVRLACMR